MMRWQRASNRLRRPRRLASLVGGVLILTACGTGGERAAPPHVEHVSLPTHRPWTIVSVQPYEGLEDVELVKFDWPTATAPSLAFALTRENLAIGDPVCLDHVPEIDTLWAHPVPSGGCEALAAPRRPGVGAPPGGTRR